jgi:hypothetical protein
LEYLLNFVKKKKLKQHSIKRVSESADCCLIYFKYFKTKYGNEVKIENSVRILNASISPEKAA